MKNTMKVGVWYNNHDVRVEERPIPKTGDRDILLNVMASGICGTDIMEWYRIRKAPLIQGHEIAGKIVEVGKGIAEYRPGERIFATHHVPCDRCRDCLRGNKMQCNDFQKVNNFEPGGFSEYVKIGGRSIETGIIKLPDGMSYEQGSFIEPLGTVVETVSIHPGDSVLVLGSGVAGILNIKYAKAMGAGRIIATDVLKNRLDFAMQSGADYAVNAKEYSPDRLKWLNDGRLADKVIVCASAKQVAEQALRSFGNGGNVIFFATPREEETVEVDFFKYWRSGFKWQPTYGAPPGACRTAFELIKNNTINVDDMITHRLSLDDIAEGFKIASEGKGLKVIIEPNKYQGI